MSNVLKDNYLKKIRFYMADEIEEYLNYSSRLFLEKKIMYKLSKNLYLNYANFLHQSFWDHLENNNG